MLRVGYADLKRFRKSSSVELYVSYSVNGSGITPDFLKLINRIKPRLVILFLLWFYEYKKNYLFSNYKNYNILKNFCQLLSQMVIFSNFPVTIFHLLFTLIGISYIIPQITGVFPFNFISIFRFVSRSSIIGEFTVYTVHPAGIFPAVKFIDLVDSLDIIAVIKRGISGRNLNSLFPRRFFLKYQKHCLQL